MIYCTGPELSAETERLSKGSVSQSSGEQWYIAQDQSCQERQILSHGSVRVRAPANNDIQHKTRAVSRDRETFTGVSESQCSGEQ